MTDESTCLWAQANPTLRDYHDTEWGIPVHDESALFERITLEAFQSGLSWLTILRKRPAFRAAFFEFDVDRVAALDDRDIEQLMMNDGIVRNRAKILAARTNAQAVQQLRSAEGLDAFLWSRKPEETPSPRSHEDVPTQDDASRALARDLRVRGFAFVGPTTMYALMEAIGMVDTHLVSCHRRGASGEFAESR